LGYDPIKDFVPITRVGSFTLMLVVDPNLPIHSIKELVNYAKSNPGKLSFASGNTAGIVGGYPHAHEDDAERAVQAELELVRAVTALSLKIARCKVALREHHPRHDPHQHDHDRRNPRDDRPSPPAFFKLAQLALQIHPPSGERVRKVGQRQQQQAAEQRRKDDGVNEPHDWAAAAGVGRNRHHDAQPDPPKKDRDHHGEPLPL
jgi:Tripartite tricarboxylate transporter family receptor